MAVTDRSPAGTGAGIDDRWYALSADDVAERLGVDPAGGLAAATAAERLRRDGPNALPAEEAVPGWRRFLEQYAAYMQIILLIAAVVSLAIGEWSTGAVLLLLTVVNAVVGLRQEGKAESAMNALKSLTKQTARVRRDGVESSIPVEEVVARRRRADHRRRQRGRRRPDHRGELARHRRVRPHRREHAGVEGDGHARRRRGRARRPDEHGVHEHAGHARQRHHARDGAGRRRPGRQDRRHAGGVHQGTDAADQAAEHDDAVDRRGRAGDDDRDVRARPVAEASRPTPCSSPRSRWRSRRSRRRCRPSCR